MRQESKNNIQKKKERKGTEKCIEKYICVVGVFCLVAISFLVGFTAGQKMKISRVESEMETIKRTTKVKVKRIQQKVEAQKEEVQQEANDKIEVFEQQILKKYDEKKYKLIEKCLKVHKGQKVQFTLAELKLDSVDIPYLDPQDESINEQKVLSYLEEWKEIIEKYPLSLDINFVVIHRLEVLEEDFKNKISVETFEKIWALKEQCEKNNAIWE